MDEVRPQIVFVDDEPNIIAALRRELAAWAASSGRTITTFGGAREALAFLESSADQVGLIVSDLRMPEMKGSDFLLAVRDRWPDIPTILLSGYSEAEELMKAVKAGIYSYVLKPWDAGYLRSELDKALELRRVRDENRRHERRVAEELSWAGKFQRSFLAPRMSPPDGLDFLYSWLPIEGIACGGDYFDLIPLGGGRVLALIGDVAGHGIKAAFVTAFLKSMIYPEYVEPRRGGDFEPAAFLVWLNERISFELKRSGELLVTMAALVLDPGAGSIASANAGHCRPLLLRDGATEELGGTGPALGCAGLAFHSAGPASYTTERRALREGDLVLAFTDGLVEGGRREGREGVPDLGALIRSMPYGPDLHERILKACLKASGLESFEDDVTLLSLRVAAGFL